MMITKESNLFEVQSFIRNIRIPRSWKLYNDPSGSMYFKIKNLEIYSTPNFIEKGVCSIEIYKEELLIHSTEYKFNKMTEKDFILKMITYVNSKRILSKSLN